MTDHDRDQAPLAGLIVVSMEQAISAPFATRQLADLGATVIKVERPEGDFARQYDHDVAGESAFFVWANRGKQSVIIDAKQPAGRARLEALIAGADVFVHNLAPAAAQRLGIDATTVHERYRHVIACEISGYGSAGPRSEDKAYDLAIQAEAGVFSVTGDATESKVGFSAADIAAAMYALTSILAAIVRRDRTGVGAVIEVSMLESLTEWMSAPLYTAVHGPGQAPRTGRRHHAIAPYGTFVLGDQSTILIAVQNDREWLSLASQVLGLPELGTDARFSTNDDRIAHVDELETIISAVLADQPAHDVRERLAQAGIATASVNTLADVWQHEQLRARGRLRNVPTPSGPMEMLTAPFNISLWQPQSSWVPALGEHDQATIDEVVSRGQRSDRAQ